ncbi:MAG: hypothetical protein ACP5UO_03695 [Thermoplasmata archaeon]
MLTIGSTGTALALSLIMGFSIFLSFPLTQAGKMRPSRSIFLVSMAVGILIFLVGDIFSDVSAVIYAPGRYVANPLLSFVFAVCIVLIFMGIFLLENRGREGNKGNEALPGRVATVVALGMGLQNLTEGLVFGSVFSTGIMGLFLVILTGFILQNFTEGFPIASPFLGSKGGRPGFIAGLYFIGGFPTVIGTLIGMHYFSPIFEVSFDGLAIGAILYVLIPMMKTLFRQAENSSLYRHIYSGIIIGFIAGFLVNAI